MGWLWGSPSNENETASSDSATNADWALSDEQRQRIFGKPRTQQSSRETRNEKADKELEDLINSLSYPDGKVPDAASKRTDQSSSSQPEAQPISRLNPDGTLNIHPTALYPRTMSCRQAFDQAYYCQSLGGKFKDIYRFGALQSCSEQWGAFWFCMRTKSYSPAEKERQIVEHYRERDERKRKQFGSSEDVWEVRTKAVERAFQRDPDEEDGADDGHLVKE
jgi:hypothetical protein